MNKLFFFRFHCVVAFCLQSDCLNVRVLNVSIVITMNKTWAMRLTIFKSCFDEYVTSYLYISF